MFQDLRGLTEKQRLRVIDGFFSKSFFLYTVRKNLSWGTKYVYKRTIPFIFFPTCHGKDILELKHAMFNLATSFHMKSRGPSGWKKKMKHKKNGSIEGEKKLCHKDSFNSWYFRKYKRMEIQHQQFFLEKGNNFNNLGKKNFLCQTLFLHSSKAIFFFVKFLVL